jgi:SRSO17 transposase
MTAEQILSLAPELANFLDEFRDCFVRSEPRNHLANDIRGQLSDLPRKSVVPIADFTNTPRRTLQEFLSGSEWSHSFMRDRVQQIVARDHADRRIIDDSGHPKCGDKTACIQRQWCGNTGKIDNCVVSVHLSTEERPSTPIPHANAPARPGNQPCRTRLRHTRRQVALSY